MPPIACSAKALRGSALVYYLPRKFFLSLLKAFTNLHLVVKVRMQGD